MSNSLIFKHHDKSKIDINLHAYALGSGKPVGWALAHRAMPFILYLTT